MSFTRLSEIPRSSELNYSSTCATCKYSKYGDEESKIVCHRFPPSKTGEDVIVPPTHHCFEYKLHVYNKHIRALVRQRDRAVRTFYHNLWQKHWNKLCGLKFWKMHPHWKLPSERVERSFANITFFWDFDVLINEGIENWDYEEALVKCSDSTIRKVEMFKQAILQNIVPNAEAFSD